MKEPKFTKQKLHVVEYAGYYHIQTGEYYGDADTLNEEDCANAKDNANLYKAAPQLYEALKNLANLSEKWGKEWFSKSELIIIEEAKSALSAAVGE